MTTRTGNWVRFAICALAASVGVHAEIRLAGLYQDHMVIQRDMPVHVWGWAGDGEEVSVTFHGNTRTTKANDIGRWSVYLPPVEAGGPFELSVSGSSNITLHDVLVGDVWVASGQSNMEFMLEEANNAKAEIAEARDSSVRAFLVEHAVATHPLENVKSPGWAVESPETAAKFSAVGYFFARSLRQKHDVPIGLIESYWGGTPVEAWTSLDGLSSDSSLMPVFIWWARMNNDAVDVKFRRNKQLAAWEESVQKAKAEGKEPPGRPWRSNDDDSWSPTGLYNGMIAPLTPFPIRGVIWYQGETNANEERAYLYPRTFQTMIQDWRKAWGVGDFPFLFVQLANYKVGPGNRWPELRDAQLQTLALNKTAMASATDIGDPDNIHPRNKQDVGARLALGARVLVFGDKVEYSGPLYRQAAPEGSSLRVWFTHVGAGLKAKDGSLAGFEVAGADRKFQPAEARIDGETVVVSSSAVPAPRFVRYAWSDNPVMSLYNKEGLPASPFQTAE